MDGVKESDKAYLDNLLDEVLEDFSKPVEKKSENVRIKPQEGCKENAWTEELIQEATKNFELTMRKLMESQQLPEQDSAGGAEMNSVMSEFIKLAEASAKATVEPSKEIEKGSHLTSTMKEMNQSCKELQEPPSPEDVAKMFANLGMTGDDGEQGAAGLFSLMQNMMENILSKSVIYPPVKEIVDKFPDWLADNKSKLTEEEYTKHNKQYYLLKKVIDTFEDEKESDTAEKKRQNFDHVLELMQQLQEIGQPPAEICGDVGSGAADLSALLSSAGLDPSQQKMNAEGCKMM